MRIGFHDPHLATMGGGERYLLAAMAAVAGEAELTLLSPTPPDSEGVRRLGVHLAPDAFRWSAADVTAESRQLDVLFSLTNEVPPRSHARRSVAMIQFPHRSHTGPRARVLRLAGLSRAVRALASYDSFLCNSEFTRSHVRARLGVDAAVLPPPIDVPASVPGASEREPLILAVGRFFRGWHSKNQHVLIEAMERLGASGWHLVLAGGADDGAYVRQLRERADGLPVELRLDVPRPELERLYGQAALFWHAAGHAQDERHPERLEHFGITTVEAMAHAVVPLVFAAGGPAEVVEDSRTGRHWRTIDELAALSRELIDNRAERSRVAEAARAEAQRYSSERFKAAIRAELLGS